MADLQRAAFVEIPSRGKGGHSFWKQLTYAEIPVITLSGQLEDDVKRIRNGQGGTHWLK